MRTVGPRRMILGVSEPWEARPGYQTVENPFVLEYEGRYYLLYSGNDWRTADYAMGYAVSSSPLGPFVKASKPLVSQAPGVTGPGGGSVVIGPGGGHWLVYHARRDGFEHSRKRTLHIDPLVVGGGSMSTSGPTPGLARLPLSNLETMDVELLWWEGCPSWPSALDELKKAMGELGLDPESVELREIESDEQAERERFPGSPTIRIDGADIVPANGEPASLTCRVYRLRDGRISPTPDPEDVREALERSLT